MSYAENPYYSPEACGLTLLDSLEDPAAIYSFNTFALWTDGKRLLWASDSGCSCPSPFESTEPTPATKTEVCNAVDRWVDEVSEYQSTQTRAEVQTAALELKALVRSWRPGKAAAGDPR